MFLPNAYGFPALDYTADEYLLVDSLLVPLKNDSNTLNHDVTSFGYVGETSDMILLQCHVRCHGHDAKGS